MIKIKNLLKLLLLTTLSACIEPIIPPEIISKPATPPSIKATPSPLPSTSPSIEASPPPLIAKYYRLDFGPGSKGLDRAFGPGSKGPGSAFGPGSKGLGNLQFNVNFDQLLLRNDLTPFQLNAAFPLKVERLRVRLVQNEQLVIETSILPQQSQIKFETPLFPGTYHISSLAEGNFTPLEMSGAQVEVLSERFSEVRVALRAKELDPASLDIEILTRSNLVKK